MTAVSLLLKIYSVSMMIKDSDSEDLALELTLSTALRWSLVTSR